MKSRFVLAFGLPFLFLTHAKAQTFPISTFAGINTDDSPLLLKNGQTPGSQNVRTDEPGGGLEGRQGFAIANTQSCSDVWEFPNSNGTRYVICRSTVTNTLIGGQNIGNLNIIISTVSAAFPTVASVLGDKFFWSNKTDGLSYWTGTSTVAVNSSLKFDNLVTHQGRLWGSGVPGAERTIYGSALSDGTDFALVATPADDDPTQIVVGGANDEVLAALYASFQGRLMWFKAHSFGAILGVDRSDFELKTYSDKIGTAYKDSIQDCAGFLRFLGPLRTLWEFDGGQFIKISEPIDNLMATFTQGDANNRSRSWTTKEDFDRGSNNFTSNAISAGDVKLSLRSDGDTSGTDFGAGTSVNMDTTTFDGELILSKNNVNHLNNSFESVTGTCPNNWLCGGVNTTAVASGAGGPGVPAPQDGSVDVLMETDTNGLINRGYEFIVLDVNGDKLYDSGPQTLLIALRNFWDQNVAIVPTSIRGKRVRIAISAGDFNSNKYGTVQSTDFFVASGDPFFFYIYHSAQATGNCYVFLDLETGGRSTIGNGTFTSRTFDTLISSPAFLPSSYTITPNGNDINLYTQTSSDGSSWNTRLPWTNGSAPISPYKEFVRYQVDMATNSTSDGVPFFTDATLNERASSGSIVLDSFSLGSISQFGSITGNSDTDNGNISYVLFTDTDASKTIVNGVPVASSFVASQTITLGQIPTLSTQAYAFIASTFSITLATQDPTLNDIQLNWSEGSILRVASGFPSQRYWLAMALNSSSNNRILIYDKNREWQLDSGENAVSMANYNGNWYFSNGSGIFQMESGYTDNGSSITSFYTTPTFAPSGVDLVSTFANLFVTTDHSVASLATTYQINGTSTNNSLPTISMSELSGLQNRKLPFANNSLVQGKYIDLTWTVAGTNFWRILGTDLEFRSDKFPQ